MKANPHKFNLIVLGHPGPHVFQIDHNTRKLTSSIKDFSSKCDQIRRKLGITINSKLNSKDHIDNIL